MLEAFVITLREGVEASLIVAILLAYLRKTGRTALAPFVYGGVLIALVLSTAFAFALRELEWDAEAFEGFAMLAGAACVVGLIIWMNRHARGLRREIEARVDQAMDRPRGPALALLALTSVMILREGVETVLFLMATSFTASGIAQLLGVFLGLALSLVFAVSLLRGSLRVDLGRFFRVTTIVLFVLAFQLVVGGLHELSESGILPSSQAEMAIVGPIVRHDTLIFLIALVLAITLVGIAPRQPAPSGASEAEEVSPAERRKRLAGARRERWAQRGGLALGLVVVALLTVGMLRQPGPPAKEPGTLVTAQNGSIRVPVAQVGDGGLHFLEVNDPEKPGSRLRFFVIRTPSGGMQACMDACEICGDKGYYAEQGGVTCRNCSAPINLSTLGKTGGCNPIPVVSRVEGDQLVVDAASIYAQRGHLKGHK